MIIHHGVILSFAQAYVLQHAVKRNVATTPMRLFHGTNTQFEEFRNDRASFFFPDEREADALVKAHFVDGFVLHCAFVGRIASHHDALKVWNSVNTEERFYLYSMLCRETQEFSDEEIDRFETALKAAGYDAVSYYDYSQLDNQKDATAIVVFNTATIKIVGRKGHK